MNPGHSRRETLLDYISSVGRERRYDVARLMVRPFQKDIVCAHALQSSVFGTSLSARGCDAVKWWRRCGVWPGGVESPGQIDLVERVRSPASRKCCWPSRKQTPARAAWGKSRTTAYNADLVKAWLKPK